MSPSVRNLATVAQLDVAVQRGRESGRLAVVKFYAPWCVSCKAIKPKFERAARANDAADFYEVDFVAARPLCKAASVRYLPSAHIYGDGELQHAVPVGVRSFPKFLFKLKEAMGGEPPPPPPPPRTSWRAVVSSATTTMTCPTTAEEVCELLNRCTSCEDCGLAEPGRAVGCVTSRRDHFEALSAHRRRVPGAC